MKELPKMYQNKINKKISNRQEVYSTMDKSLDIDDNDTRRVKAIKKNNDIYTIEQKIYDIFNSKDYIYKADVVIVTDKGTFNKRIVGKNRNNLITMDNEYIDISTIKDIYKNN